MFSGELVVGTLGASLSNELVSDLIGSVVLLLRHARGFRQSKQI